VAKKETILEKKAKRARRADVKLISELAAGKELTRAEIGKLAGCSPNRVSEILQEIKTSTELKEFASNKDKVFEDLQYRLVNLADDDTLKSMLNKRGFTDLGILEDKTRLIRGESTANIAYDARIISVNVAELKKMVEKAGIEQDSEVVDITNK
jgi:arsenate reductase-like glutaredoxin family protein